MSKEWSPQISYYMRNSLYNHVITEATSFVGSRGNDPALQFWKAVATGMLGQPNAGVRELEELRSKRDVAYPVLAALLFFHQREVSPDEMAMEEIMREMTGAEQQASGVSELITAGFFFYTGNYYEARRWIRRALPDGKITSSW